MEQYILKSALEAEIEKMLQEEYPCDNSEQTVGYHCILYELQDFLDTLEEKEFQEKNLYVVTRCEEHSDYVEKVFFSKKKAEEYCKQFEGDEDAYCRDITEIKVDCPPFEVKEVDLEKELDELIRIHKPNGDFGWGTLYNVATHFFELGLKAQKGE